MLNDFVYCPRLAYREWVQGEWPESADTVQAHGVHQRGDKPGGKLPEAAAMNDAAPEQIHARSISLASPRPGLVAKLDLIEGDGAQLIPVDHQMGKRPHVARGAHDPERVQVCAKGLILREHGVHWQISAWPTR